MAITINWETKVINIPKADLTLEQTFPSEIRSLDINTFHLVLRNLEYSEEGMLYPPTHNYNSPINIGGVQLARVLEIINGYTITFENGIYICQIINGNNNISDVTNLNNVSIRTTNSAGLIFNEVIEDQSFMDGRIYIDTVNGVLDSNFPSGTPSRPVYNYAIAEAISQIKNFHKYDLRGNITFSGNEILNNQNWYGSSYNNSVIVFNGNSVINSYFTCINISGTLLGNTIFEKCYVGSIIGFSGTIKECYIANNITLDNSNTDPILIIDSYSAVAGISRPILDVNDADCNINIRGYLGGLTVSNFSQGNNMSIDVVSGTIELTPTCTSGTIVVSGVCQLIDNSNGATVITNGIITKLIDESNSIKIIKNNSSLIPATL